MIGSQNQYHRRRSRRRAARNRTKGRNLSRATGFRPILNPVMDTRAFRTKSGASATRASVIGRTPLTPIRLVSDGVCIVIALAIALIIRFGLGWFEVTEASPPTVGHHAAASITWIIALTTTLAINRLYDEDTLFRGGGEVARVLRSVIEAGAVMAAFVFLTQSFYVSRSWFSLIVLLSFTALAGERILLRNYLSARRRTGTHRRPAILVGRGERWEDWPFEEEHEFEVVARLDPGRVDEYIEQIATDERVSAGDTAVVLRARDFTHDEFWRILLVAGERGWSVFVHSPVRSVGRDRLTVRSLAGQTIVKVAPPALVGMHALQKRAFDMIVSATAILFLSPFLLIIAAMVLATSGHPVLFRQQRVGVGGRLFSIIKFRSMPLEAEAATGPVWASANDERPTRIGRFLRRTSMDELPQLWNVLKGEMSLVGPRPERPSFAGDFSRDVTWYRFRHRIRPGMTGWAQSHGLRGNTSIDSRVQFDNWYIENWSIWLDMRILALTIRELVRARAY